MRRMGRCAAALSILIGTVAGCGGSETLIARYQAERLHWSAEREELTMRLVSREPDSLRLLHLLNSYRAVGNAVAIPQPIGRGEEERMQRGDLIRVIGTSELKSGDMAIEANRLDLAVEAADRVDAMAEGDTLLRRRADFLRLRTFRQFHRNEDAIAVMRKILDSYPPAIAPDLEEDPILSLPEAIVQLREAMRDEAGMRRAISDAGVYYRRQMDRAWPPVLEARILARLIRIAIARRDWDSALRDLNRLEALAQSEPSLRGQEGEIRYSMANIQTMKSGIDRVDEAVERLDRVTGDFPQSPFGARAAFDAGMLLENAGRLKEAVDHYWVASTLVQRDRDVAPHAAYRRALLEEKLGEWERSKILLESIPELYPDTEPAVQAPMALVRRYQRMGEPVAARASLRRAIRTYRSLLARDSTSIFASPYRWGIAQAQMALDQWSEALLTIDEMNRADPDHPLTAQGLLEGARLAEAHGMRERGADYLAEFLAVNPDAPEAAKARRDLARLRKTPMP